MPEMKVGGVKTLTLEQAERLAFWDDDGIMTLLYRETPIALPTGGFVVVKAFQGKYRGKQVIFVHPDRFPDLERICGGWVALRAWEPKDLRDGG